VISTNRLLWVFGGFYGIAIAILVNLVSQKIIDRQFKLADAIRFYFDVTFEVAVWQIVLAALIATGILLLLNRTIEQDRQAIARLKEMLEQQRQTADKEMAAKSAELHAQIEYRDQTIETLKQHLHDAREFNLLDVVTGIPNEASWQKDIGEFATKASADTPRQVALIDLVDFGRLNDELGYSKVDKILRYLAKSLEESMRKNEGLYKRHLVDNALLPSRIYRKYPGGDEFYVVAEGTESSMLGLLTRLQRLITSRLDKHISENIVQVEKPLHFLFTGAVCQLYRGEAPGMLTQRLEDHLRQTRYPDATRRLIWESGKTSSDFPQGSFERNLYEQAEREFSIART
jgi:GGDEF domain-containing protein